MTWYEKLASRKADLTIENDGEIYMERWWLIPRNKYFNVYLHKISHSDEPTLHDHEYMSLSYCLKGVMKEILLGSYRVVAPGDFIFRLPSTLHYLKKVSTVVWTIFITGPRVRLWGFQTLLGWEPWYLYLDRKGMKAHPRKEY